MKKLMIAAATVALTAGGIALPATATASASGSHPSGNHQKQHGKQHGKHHGKHHAKPNDVQRHPCEGDRLGIDIALGSQNICIPL
jgi:hypothetical protein